MAEVQTKKGEGEGEGEAKAKCHGYPTLSTGRNDQRVVVSWVDRELETPWTLSAPTRDPELSAFVLQL